MQVGGVSVAAIDVQAEAAAARSREEFLARRQANKERIEASLSKRPSLMERHNREVEAQAAADKALGIVGDAMVSTVYVKAKNELGKGSRRGRGKENASPRDREEDRYSESKYGDDDDDDRDRDRDRRREGESKSKQDDDGDDYRSYGRSGGRDRDRDEVKMQREKRRDYRSGLLSRSEQTLVGMRDSR